MSTPSPFTTTPAPSGTNGGRDTLLIVTSVAMAVATLALVFVVRVLDRCSPGRSETTRSESRRRESPEERAERLQELINEQATSLTYRLWGAKKRRERNAKAAPDGEVISDKAEDFKQSGVDVQRIESAGSFHNSIIKSISADLAGVGVVSSEELPSSDEGPGDDESDWTCDCAICLGEFEDEEMVCELKCGHIFHEECLHGWFVSSRKPRCPVCRMEVKSEKDNEEVGDEQSSNVPEQSVSTPEANDAGLAHRLHPIVAI
ncbi:hypothetical protein FOZ60_011501 [Perkinsus olseni]|uniref:RING-type domain-containing protein n=1 Tax=Perkinsus olseni TaxID=32597 RepID=A0A7J6PBL1_PEROL|nr:hypothetical protein FOZ60_011501 [Perkinsus olseni]